MDRNQQLLLLLKQSKGDIYPKIILKSHTIEDNQEMTSAKKLAVRVAIFKIVYYLSYINNNNI